MQWGSRSACRVCIPKKMCSLMRIPTFTQDQAKVLSSNDSKTAWLAFTARTAAPQFTFQQCA